jgi:hypothetical protein
MGGFVEDGFLYHAEDWRVLVKSKLHGLRIGTIPDALVWYKAEPWRNQINWRKTDLWGARGRVVELVREHHGSEVALLLKFAQGLLFEQQQPAAPRPQPTASQPQANRQSANAQPSAREAQVRSPKPQQATSKPRQVASR